MILFTVVAVSITVLILIIIYYWKREEYIATCVPRDKCLCNHVIYQTMFSEADDAVTCSSYEERQTTNPFTRYSPCLNCVSKNVQDRVTFLDGGCRIDFPPTTGSSETFWVRIGNDACEGKCDPVCSQDCCPSIGDMKTGVLCAWIYFPPENSEQVNLCNYNDKTEIPRDYPFYHGGKLFGVCSGQCPTGNSSTDTRYNDDWTIRLMFREGGRLVLLYSVPLGGFNLEPVPPQLRETCFKDSASLTSISTDQYWYATLDSSYHPYRMAEYTFNAVSGINCVTQKDWPDGEENPIPSILKTGKWNYVKMEWDVDDGRVRVFHQIDNDLDENTIPTYTPDSPFLVIDTPKDTIPFQSKKGAQTFYFQPFYGGKADDWLPVPVDEDCNRIDTTDTPYFIFGDIFILKSG